LLAKILSFFDKPFGKLFNCKIPTITRQTNSDATEHSRSYLHCNLRYLQGGSGIFAGKDGENISGVYSTITDLRSKETMGSGNCNF